VARLQLWELEDQPWFPSVLRDAGTAYLRFAAELTRQPRYMVPKLAELLRDSETTRIVDLCSGGGGPVAAVVAGLRADGIEANAVLTDLYPSEAVLKRVAADPENTLRVHPEPVDARDVPKALSGCRTLFNAFHHFPPQDARRVLQGAIDAREPIAIFEVAERSATFLFGILFVPLFVMLSVPFLRPFDWRWLPFTYLIPLIPLFVLWDGLVSGLRAYSPAELDWLAVSLDARDYVWESGRVKLGGQPAHVTYLLGCPERS
jgi:hypothetical protein